MRWAIWYHSYNIKNAKNNHGEVLLVVKFTKCSTPPWVFFMLFKLCKWYQIAQNITRFSLSHIFQYMDRIQGHIWENTYQRNLYIRIFYPVWRISLISPEIYILTPRTHSSVWNLWKNAGNFAVLVCCAAYTRQKSDSFYIKFSVEWNELIPSFWNQQEVA